MKNPYEILGINKTATLEELKSAYRKLAKQYHPDINIGSFESHEKMVDINAAYEFLQLQYSRYSKESSESQNATYSKQKDTNKEKTTKDTGSTFSDDHWEAYWAKHKAYAKAEYESMGNRMKDKVARNLDPIRIENLMFSDAIRKAKNYEELLDICKYFNSKLDDMINKMYDYVQKKHRYGMPPNYVFGEERERREEKNKQNLKSLENIAFLEVISSYIASVAYDDGNHVLYVKFKDSSVFLYFNVTKESYIDLIKAKSIGSHFIKNIRDNYEYEPLVI